MIKSKRKDGLFSGQSLFEVIFALGIIAIMMTSVVSLTTKTVSNASYSTSRVQATHLAREAIEWLRQERDASWSSFTCYASAVGDTYTYCLNDLSSWPATSGDCTDPITGTNFEREVDLTLRSSAGGTEDIIDAIVTVSWTDAQGEHSVSSATEFTKWREISAGGCPTPTPEP